MGRYQPDDSFKGGGEYFDWGSCVVGDGDGIHCGPNGEFLLLERKHSAYEIERDSGQRHRNLRYVRHNKTMWVVYCITNIKVTEHGVQLQVNEAYRLLPSGILEPLRILFMYPGNVYEICKLFDTWCKKNSRR